MLKKMILTILMIFISSNVYALTYGGCEYSSVSKLKSLITNINISYEYHIENNIPKFDITLTNIPEYVYFKDSYNKKEYNYSNTNNGEITIKDYYSTDGSYKFYSALGECYGIAIGAKYYKLPKYNYYYGSTLCEGVESYSLCQKWTNVNYSYDEFAQLIKEYKDNLEKKETTELIEHKESFIDSLINFYFKNYYYIYIGIIVVLLPIIIIKKRKDSFKF